MAKRSQTIRDLVGNIVAVQMNTSNYSYPRFGLTMDEAWARLCADIDQMRSKFGDIVADQLLDMSDQALQHYRDGYRLSPARKPRPEEPGFMEIKLGTRLMQDIEWVARGRHPFAYPKELYRWPTILRSRAAGDPDLEADFK